MLNEPLRDDVTHGSSETEQVKEADRRVARRKSVLLRARIYPIEVFCDAHIQDISATGLKGEADVELAIGQTLHITTDERTYHAAGKC